MAGCETARAKIYDRWIILGGPVFSQMRGVQNKPLLATVDSQMSSVQNNTYATGGTLDIFM